MTEAIPCSIHSPCYALDDVITNILGGIWRYLPGAIRRRMVRLGQKRFTVTAGGLLFDKEGRLLLLEHVFRPDSGWGVPGGFLSQGEQPEEALRRELREEIGIEITDVRLILVRAVKRPRQIEIYFQAHVIGTPEPRSFEIKTARWFTIDQLPPELSQTQKRLIQRALSADENSQQ